MGEKTKGLLVTDLDGTIVGSGDLIPNEVHQAIHNFHRMGILFTVATGRGFKSVQPYNLPIACPGVYENGGKLLFPNGRPLRLFPLSKKEIGTIIGLLQEQLSNIGYALFPDLTTHLYTILVPKSQNREEVTRRYATSLDKILHDPEEFFEKMLKGTARVGVAGDIHVATNRLSHSTNDAAIGTKFHEFNHRGTHKGSGVKFVASHLSIAERRVIVVGNDMNDVAMFRQPFGYRIAVGKNCPPALLNRSTHRVVDLEELPFVLKVIAAEMCR